MGWRCATPRYVDIWRRLGSRMGKHPSHHHLTMPQPCRTSPTPLRLTRGRCGLCRCGRGQRGDEEGDYLTPVRIASGCLSAFPPARMDMLRACARVVAPVCGCRTDALSLLWRWHAGATSAEGGGGTMGA